MKNKNLLIVFTRNPALGKVKSRLAKDIGDVNALEIYKELLRHTNEITKNIAVDKWVFYSENIQENDLWETSVFSKKLQKGATLGDKMSNAFIEGFDNGYENIIIIGSDIYDLKSEHIKMGFSKLLNFDTVLGPAIDGGYYLFGMKTYISEVFKNKNWGKETVLKNTVSDLEGKKTIYFLETLNDIDVISDINVDSFLAKYI